MLLLLLLGVDRIAESTAEKQLVTVVEDEAASYDTQADDVSVSLSGFPFLTQVISGTFTGATINMDGVTFGDTKAISADVDLNDVTVPRDVLFGEAPHDIVAETANATVVIHPDEIAEIVNNSGRAIDVELSTKSGELRASLPIDYHGYSATVSGVVVPKVIAGRLSLHFVNLTADGQAVPAPIADYVDGLLEVVNLPQLPFELALESVSVVDNALKLKAHASNVEIVN